MQFAAESRVAANLVNGLTIAVGQFGSCFRGQRAREQAAPETAHAEPRGFFGSEDEQFNGMPGLKFGAPQSANGFQTAKNSHDAIILSGVRNGVNVGTGADRWSIGIRASPAREHISDGVVTNLETGSLATRRQPRTRIQVAGGKHHSGYRRRFRV